MRVFHAGCVTDLYYRSEVQYRGRVWRKVTCCCNSQQCIMASWHERSSFNENWSP